MAVDDEEWVYDDPAIPDEAFVHRRLNDDQQLVFDDELERFVLSVAAYRYVDADGMSVYVSSEMTKNEVSEDDLFEYCTHGLARIRVSVVRLHDDGAVISAVSGQTRGGVILREATGFPDDVRIRKSHGLVRIHVRPKGKPYWNDFRNRLIQGSEYRASTEAEWVAAGAA